MIWEWAGVTGLDPRPLTLRQLWWAYLGRMASQWEQTASLMALSANLQRSNRRDRIWVPADFWQRPGASHRQRGMTREKLQALAAGLGGRP